MSFGGRCEVALNWKSCSLRECLAELNWIRVGLWPVIPKCRQSGLVSPCRTEEVQPILGFSFEPPFCDHDITAFGV